MNKETILKLYRGDSLFQELPENLMLEGKNFYLNWFTVRNACEI